MLPLFKVFMNSSVDEELKSVLHSGFISQGKQVEKFEEKLKEYFEYPHLLSVNSATSGLTLALRMIKDKYGSGKVLCTPLTCTATNWPVLANNLDIVWVDVDPETCCMNLTDLQNKISEKTVAILFVHWGGTPGDIREVMKIRDEAEKRLKIKIDIVEDCAHCFGAEVEDKKLGTLGNYAVYSFQAIKQLTCGDGGLLLLPDEKEYTRAKKLRWFGIDREKRSLPGKDFRLEEDISDWGYKFHMNDINATIGLSNLSCVPENIEKCRKNQKIYNEKLKNLSSVKLVKNSEKDSPWIYSIKVINKPSFISFMNDKNIMVSQVHNRNDFHSCVSDYWANLPLLDSLEKRLICIPVGWWLNEDDVNYICDTIIEWSRKEINIQKMSDVIKDYSQEYVNTYISLMKEFNGMYDVKNNFELMDKSKIYLLINHGKVIGSAYVHEEIKLYDNLGYIDDVIISENYRSKGYGKIFVEYLADNLLKNCYKIILSCKKDKIAFYKKCGFQEEGICMVRRK